MTMILDGTAGITFNDASIQNTTAGVFGFKNRVHNGAMGIWQRGTSGFSTASGIYTADRFTSSLNGNTATVTQDTSVPNAQFKYSLKAVPVSNATTTEFVIRQFIEQQNIYDFAGNTVTFSAWVNCSKSTLKLRVGTQNTTGGGDSTQTFSVNIGTWTKISGSFSSFSSITAWTSNPYDRGAFVDIGFVDSSALTTADYIYITGVQLEKGSTATSFDYRPIGTELMLCQRYCQYAGSGASGSFDNGTTSIQIMEKCIVTMRAAPAGSIISGVTATFRSLATDFSATSPVLANFSSFTSVVGGTSFWTNVSGFTGGTANAVITARNIVTTNGGNFILLTAEL